MREGTYTTERRYDWMVYGLAVLLVGGLGGYILSVEGFGSRRVSPAGIVPATTSSPVPTQAPAGLVNEDQLRAYRDILARDPKNVEAAVSAANLLYDAQRYVEAVPFYEQAAALSPSDINISTDLGTALWYAGRPDDALRQFDRSLELNPTHPQTLFNAGIVAAEGKHDYARAAASWEKLLAAHPTYENVARVRQLIADAKAKARS